MTATEAPAVWTKPGQAGSDLREALRLLVRDRIDAGGVYDAADEYDFDQVAQVLGHIYDSAILGEAPQASPA